ncbi:hypothetical protein CJ030_MR2G002025 [Morella rubra]|uniref:Uncharacterized protein n=1 Tax=Morella rubra TaxID=262757 RepID=A0A6A1WHJ3_9ROSI|nr:hypothetical protein CJ030_MR2G002025 [Morella rubra]
MDGASDCASVLPWIWVIEALASVKEVDVSILHDLIEMAPELPDSLGKNMREMLALRCLEVLFDPCNGITNDARSALASKVGVDTWKSCEDILEQIVQETSLSDLKMAGPELLKWDMLPFINHKRACMPKFALQKLKDSILEGTHPFAESLKERSGLLFTAGGKGPVNMDNPSALIGRVNESCFDAQHMGVKLNLIRRTIKDGNKLLENDLGTGNLLPSKRERNALSAENMVGDFHENQYILNDYDNPNINAKKQKQFVSSSILTMEENPVTLSGREFLELSSEGFIPVSEGESCDLAKGQKGTLKEGRVLEDKRDEYPASMKSRHNTEDGFHHIQLEIRSTGAMMPQDTSGDVPHQDISVDKDNDDDKHCSEQMPLTGALPPYNASMLVQDTSADKPCQNMSVDDVEDDSNLCVEPRTSGGPRLDKTLENEEDMDPSHEAGTLSDSDGYQNEHIDVAISKSEFLSSQCTNSHDLSAGWTDQTCCIKCNEGGQLLVCNRSNCPLAVHEICLGSSPRFDDNGNFYCPFCAYSLAVSEYLEAKKKASLARKELTWLFGSGLKCKQKEPVERVHTERNKLPRNSGDKDLLVRNHEDGYLEERVKDQTDHEGDHVNKVSNLHFRSADDKQQAEPSASCDNVYLPLREEEAAGMTRILNLTEEKEVEEELIQAERVAEGDKQETADHECDGDYLSCRSTDVIPVNETRVEEGIQQEVLDQHIADPPGEPVCTLDNCAVDTSDDESNKSLISNYSVRFRRRPSQYTYTPSPQLRRKKVPWTSEEEEILKEGVQKFSDTNDSTIPWKKILEFGADVFLNRRRAVDLKDKWRNMCKGSAKST